MRQHGRLLHSKLAAYCSIFAILLIPCLAGCTEKQAPITSYKVKKHDLIQIPLSSDEEAAPTTAPDTIPDPTDRILGATILIDGMAWYFKGAAPIDKWPDGADEKFDKLIASLKFDNPSKPSWELGEEWIEKPGSSSMRAADLVLGDVTFSVIRLPNTGPNDREYLLLNMNRWRNQLKLGRIDSAQLAQNSHKIQTADGNDATIVNYLGKVDASAMPPMMAGGMGGASSKKPSSRSSITKPDSTSSKKDNRFTSQPPASWQKTKPGMFQVEKYLLEDGETKGTASVSTAGGSVLMNVKRWRGQVGLPDIESEDEVNAEPVKVSEIDGLLLRLIGEERSIVVAMVPDLQSGRNWFFKLDGDTSLVEKEADVFIEYLSTVKIN